MGEGYPVNTFEPKHGSQYNTVVEMFLGKAGSFPSCFLCCALPWVVEPHIVLSSQFSSLWCIQGWLRPRVLPFRTDGVLLSMLRRSDVCAAGQSCKYFDISQPPGLSSSSCSLDSPSCPLVALLITSQPHPRLTWLRRSRNHRFGQGKGFQGSLMGTSCWQLAM